MILVDTSVWVDYFNGVVTLESETLHAALGEEEIIVGDLILTEVLQGFRQDRDYFQARRLLQSFPVANMLGPDLAVQCADNYRLLRKRGVTVRKTLDIMIGTYCIAHGFPLLYADRDFDVMVRHAGLQSAARV